MLNNYLKQKYGISTVYELSDDDLSSLRFKLEDEDRLAELSELSAYENRLEKERAINKKSAGIFTDILWSVGFIATPIILFKSMSMMGNELEMDTARTRLNIAVKNVENKFEFENATNEDLVKCIKDLDKKITTLVESLNNMSKFEKKLKSKKVILAIDSVKKGSDLVIKLREAIKDRETSI